ncbi:MAG TPA: TonB-dependent receptor [Desulfobacteraceae bacterium]|nr:TonB-dependent receptor [Desulfobacteraceae bacterium]HPJ68081.1 TonB-dependent receptor [Desulfobacteraceae bacterium]HPQ28636.1 TonB-dependent receptor [Desulfobacteraceae bacterium]
MLKGRWGISRVIMVIIALFIIIPNTVRSEDKQNAVKDSSDVYTLGEVVVSGRAEGVETISTFREITAEEIQNQGARNLSEALDLLPGVDIRYGAQGVPRVDIRGFRSRHVILLLNGIPFNSSFDGQFDPSIIPVENIARIKVSYNNHSVLYGPGGLGGVIDIITKKGTKEVHGKLHGQMGEGDLTMGKFNLSGGKGSADFFISGSALDRDCFPLSHKFDATSEQKSGDRDNSDKKAENLFANIGYAPTDVWKIGVVMNYLNGEYGIPPITINDKSDPYAQSPKYERMDNYSGFSGQLSTELDIPGPVTVRGSVYASKLREETKRYDNNQYNSMDDTSIKGTGWEKDKTNIKGGSIQTQYDLQSAGMITLGLMADRQEFDANGEVRDNEVKKKKYDFRAFSSVHHVTTYTAAMEYEVSPVDNLGLVLGYSHSWFKKEADEDDDEGSFLAGANYDISEDTRIKGSFSRNIRFPSIRQLYEEGTGNSKLTTETSYTYEVGVEQSLPGNSLLTVTGFYSDLKDYIEKNIDDVYENNEKYRFRGIEVTAQTRFIDNLLLRLGYTLIDSKDKSEGTAKDELQYRPKHKVTLEAKYTFACGFSAYMDIIYNAEQYYYSRKEPITKAKLQNYTLVNIKFDKELMNGKFNLFAGADNLFDKNYEQSYGYPQPGRVIYGGIEFSF